MKVAYFFSRYPVPSQTFCDTELRAVAQCGVEVEVLACSPPTTSFRHSFKEHFPDTNIPVFYAPPTAILECYEAQARAEGTWPEGLIAKYDAAFGPQRESHKRARLACYFAELCKQRGIEHVHVHFTARAAYTALFLSVFNPRLSFSLTAHAQDFLIDLNDDKLLNELCNQAAFVVAVSDWSQKVLADKCPQAASQGKIRRIYNGLVLKEGTATPAAVGQKTVVRILSIARLIEFKGFHVLIEACRLLAEKGLPFQCEIIGDGPLADTLAVQIRAAHLENHVQLLGLKSQSEIFELLNQCDIFALASLIDSKGASDVLPTVILEAMLCHKPVVSTTIAGIPEMVVHDETGLLVKPNDSNALAAALEKIIHNAALRQTMGNAGRERLAALFSTKKSASELISFFKENGVSDTDPNLGQESQTICLLSEWPKVFTSVAKSQKKTVVEDPYVIALTEFHQQHPCAKWIVLGRVPYSSKNPSEKTTKLSAPTVNAILDKVECLPDAMVLESHWRENPALAHQLESVRKKLGSAISTEQFLANARCALWLHTQWQSRNDAPKDATLHAFGSQAEIVVLLWQALCKL